MNCTINSASNFSGLQAGISQISPAQLAAPVRKPTLNRPFISPILDCAFFREFIIPTHPEPDEVCKRLSNPEAMRGNLNWDRGNPLAKSYVVSRVGKLRYPRINVPTLGIWSPGDTYLLEEHMRNSGDYLNAEWRYLRLSSGSHWCMLDNPVETNAAIIDWLADHRQ